MGPLRQRRARAPRAAGQRHGRAARRSAPTVWGDVAPDEAPAARTPFRYPGQYADEETGLSYNRWRYYDPDTGRYISPDPLSLEGSLRAYAYAGNSPLEEIDPTGLVQTVVTGTAGQGTGGSNTTYPENDPQRNNPNIHPIVQQAMPPNMAEPQDRLYPAGGRPPQACGEPRAMSDYIRRWEEQNNGGRQLDPNNPRDHQKIRDCMGSINNVTSTDANGPRRPCPNCSQMLANLNSRWGGPPTSLPTWAMANRDDDVAFLEGWLSARALDGLRRLHARRDPAQAPSRQEVVKALRQAGLPVARPILELEETISGLTYRVPRGASFAHVRIGVLPALATRSEDVLTTLRGAKVAPISLVGPNSGLVDLYVDEAGVIYMADEIAGSAPMAEHFQVFLEREALQGLPRPEGSGATWIYTPERMGASWAEAAGAELLPEASDSYQSVYWGPRTRVLERAPHPYDLEGTYAGSAEREVLFEMLRRLHDTHPGAPVRLTPAPPAIGDAAAAREPLLRLPRLADMGTDVAGELWVVGSPGHPSFAAAPVSSRARGR